jgi:hypothetical protein
MTIYQSMLISETSEMPLLRIDHRNDGIAVITFESVTPLYTFTMQAVENCFRELVPETDAPLYLLFDFRQVEPLQRQTIQRLKPIFGILSDNPLTRSAYLVSEDSQYLMIYETCVILNGAQLGSSEAFQREDSAINWLLEN